MSFTSSTDPESTVLATEVRDVFTMSFLREALAVGLPGYRARLLTVEVVAMLLIHLILGRLQSLRELISQLQMGKLAWVPSTRVSASALYKRLAVLPHTVFLNLLKHTCATVRTAPTKRGKRRAALAPFAQGIYAVDDTTLDALARKIDTLKSFDKGDYGTLGGRLGCTYDLIHQTFVAFAHDTDSTSNERHRLEILVAHLSAGALVVFDLGYFSFDLFDMLSSRFLYFVTRLKDKVVVTPIATLADSEYYRDRIVFLGGDKSTERTAHPMRLIELKVGTVWWRFVTNVCDPRMLSAEGVWKIYAERWGIEVAFFVLKRALGAAWLHTCHTNGVLSQVWCSLTVYYVLGSLRTSIAEAAHWDEDDVSWELLMRRIGMYLQTPEELSLCDWLVANALDLNLKKAGQRKRRPDVLPLSVCSAMRTIPISSPTLEHLASRKPKRRPPRFTRRPSKKFKTVIKSAVRRSVVDTR
jgi:hypothetical protein